VVGPIPDSLQKVTVFSAAVAATSPQAEPAAALIAHLCEPRVQAGLAKHGMTPEAQRAGLKAWRHPSAGSRAGRAP
jgi:molybdate transport system substrate-binding protein